MVGMIILAFILILYGIILLNKHTIIKTKEKHIDALLLHTLQDKYFKSHNKNNWRN